MKARQSGVLTPALLKMKKRNGSYGRAEEVVCLENSDAEVWLVKLVLFVHLCTSFLFKMSPIYYKPFIKFDRPKQLTYQL
jgi:hypothetical protein